MVILMLINSFRLGGAEKLSYDIVKGLQVYSDCKVYLCSMGKVENSLEKAIVSRLQREGAKCLSLDKPRKSGRFQVLFSLNEILRKYSVDIIHTNGQSPDFYGRVIRMINRRIRVITTIHNTAGYSRRIELFQQKYTDQFTAVSNDVKEYAQNRLKIVKPIEVIDNGIDTQLYGSITALEEPFTILSVGRIAPQKGYNNAIKILAPFLRKHPDAIWKVYGDYDEQGYYYQCIKKNIEREGIDSSVQFMGTCTNPREIYRAASCFLLASDYEGFGIAFIEAMMVGIPVFSKHVGCLKEISDQGGIFFDIDRINVLKTLEGLYAKRLDITKMIQQNKEIIEKNYSLKKGIKQYYKLYCKLTEKQI